MWWGGECVDVYVGRDQCWVGGALAQARAERFEELASALEGARERGAARVAVWLSGDLAKPFLVGPVAGLRRWREAVALAQAMAVEAAGLTDDCEVVLEGWPGEPARPPERRTAQCEARSFPYEQAALAIACPRQCIEMIHREVRSLKLRLRSIRPWWCRVIEREALTDMNAAAMAIEDSDALTILREADGRLMLARSYSPRPGFDQVQPLVARTALAEGIAADEFRVLRWNPAVDLDLGGAEGSRSSASQAV